MIRAQSGSAKFKRRNFDLIPGVERRTFRVDGIERIAILSVIGYKAGQICHVGGN